MLLTAGVLLSVSACFSQTGTESMNTDLQRIDELHQLDMLASKAGDFATLRGLMSEDAVVLPPGGRMVQGREELDASFAALSEQISNTVVLEYRFEWREVEICGGYAFEWGYVVGREQDLTTGVASEDRHHVMRILQRQPDGSWKVHRTIWNTAAVPTNGA